MTDCLMDFSGLKVDFCIQPCKRVVYVVLASVVTYCLTGVPSEAGTCSSMSADADGLGTKDVVCAI